MEERSRDNTISIETAVREMEKEIAAVEEELKQRQLGLTMRLKVKSGTLLTNKDLINLANCIRVYAEIRIHGADRINLLDDQLVTEKDVINYLDK